MSVVAAAIIGSAVVGGVVSSSNAKTAAKAQQGASDAAAIQSEIAQDQWGRYKEIYDPLERKYVKDAQEYTSAENYQRAAGDAAATVSSQFGKARDRLSRTPGLDPSSPGFAASMSGLDLAQAATDATSQNAARQQVTTTGHNYMTDAIALGKGLPAQASATAGQAANTQQGIANSQLAQGNATAANWGNVANRVINVAGSSNWLGNAPASTGVVPGVTGTATMNSPVPQYNGYDYGGQ